MEQHPESLHRSADEIGSVAGDRQPGSPRSQSSLGPPSQNDAVQTLTNAQVDSLIEVLQQTNSLLSQFLIHREPLHPDGAGNLGLGTINYEDWSKALAAIPQVEPPKSLPNILKRMNEAPWPVIPVPNPLARDPLLWLYGTLDNGVFKWLITGGLRAQVKIRLKDAQYEKDGTVTWTERDDFDLLDLREAMQLFIDGVHPSQDGFDNAKRKCQSLLSQAFDRFGSHEEIAQPLSGIRETITQIESGRQQFREVGSLIWTIPLCSRTSLLEEMRL